MVFLDKVILESWICFPPCKAFDDRSSLLPCVRLSANIAFCEDCSPDFHSFLKYFAGSCTPAKCGHIYTSRSQCKPDQVWYPMTVASNSRFQKISIHKAGVQDSHAGCFADGCACYGSVFARCTCSSCDDYWLTCITPEALNPNPTTRQ